jgi:biotin carboxyl carrier protein
VASPQRYEIEVGGRVVVVLVARSGAGFAVTVGERTWQVDAARIDGHTLSLVLDRVWLNDTVRPGHEVVVAPNGAAGQSTVLVDGTPVAISVNGRTRTRSQDAARHAGAGPQNVIAPMPGKVVRVLVKPGDDVSSRAPLVVVEAMKMENELRAGKAGTIAEVHVREGQSVEAGALLVVIQ